MDISDLGTELDLPRLTVVSPLSNDLWQTDLLNRSSELTPLYIHRYAGVHTSQRLTWHPFWELLFVFRGRGVLRGAAPITLREHTAVLIPPHVPHCELAEDPLDVLWLGLQGSRLPRKATGMQTVRSPELTGLLEPLWLRASRPYGPIGAELDGLTQAIMARLQRLVLESRQKPDSFVDEVVTFMQRNYAQPLSVGLIASRFGYSEGYLHRSFLRRTGKTPLRFLTELRIEAAVSLLRQSTLSIGKIGRLVGYPDALHFSRVFRRITGESPKTMSMRPAPRGADPM